MRYVSSWMLLLRIAFLSIFGITQSGYYVAICGILLILTTMSTAFVKPYRIKDYNIIDVVLLSVFIQILFSAAGLPFGSFNKTVEVFLITMLVLGLMVPLMYIAMLAVYKILP